MPWALTVSVCLSAGAILGFFLADRLSAVTIEEANRRASNAQAEADHQRELADKWKHVAHSTVTEQVTELETRRQRRQQGGFGY